MAYQNWRGLAHDVAPFGDLQQSAVAADLKNYQVGKATILLQLTTLTFGLPCTKAANPKPSLGQLWGQPVFYVRKFPRFNGSVKLNTIEKADMWARLLPMCGISD